MFNDNASWFGPGWIASTQQSKLLEETGNYYSTYGERVVKKNDIIDMYFNCQVGKIKFYLNGKNQGYVYQNKVLEKGIYRMVCTIIEKGNSVKLIHYERLY